MVYTRTHIRKSRFTIDGIVRARHYPARAVLGTRRARPRQVEVPTIQPTADSPLERQLFVEQFMDDACTQSHIHDLKVTAVENGIEHKFAVFFKRHVLLTPNHSLQLLSPNGHLHVRLCSDVVVLKQGVKASYINMKARDSAIADLFMRRFSCMPVIHAKRLPEEITIVL